jgi:nicotinate-nucleotide--dimethylbenzimidazole phosphoribosyltransferase
MTVGGFELAALAGALSGAAARRLPVVLDGFAASVAALAAVRMERSLGELLIAGHRSAEPGHRIVLAELGLEPLLDLRLRLGEASGALLAVGLIEAAGRLHREMGTFAEAGIARPG